MNRYEAYYHGATPTSIETTYEVYAHEVHAYDVHAHEIRTHEVTPIKYTLMSHMPMKVYSREMACPRDARLEAYAHETHAYEIHALRMLARKVLGDLRISHLTNGGAVLKLSRFELQNNDFPRQETKVSSGRRSLGAGRTFSPQLHRPFRPYKKVAPGRAILLQVWYSEPPSLSYLANAAIREIGTGQLKMSGLV
jgi:hypothetical protein